MAHTQGPIKHQPSVGDDDVYATDDGVLFVRWPDAATSAPAADPLTRAPTKTDVGPHDRRSEPADGSAAPRTHRRRAQARTAAPRPHQPASAYDALLSSVMRSKATPLLAPPPQDRDSEPWTIAAAARSGQHRWLLPPDRWPQAVAGRRVVVLDRRGSFPAAMSSVPVAVGPLAHRGPIDRPIRGMAGLYLIEPPEADRWDFPPPLGRLVGQLEDGRVWVTDPHVELLRRRLGLAVEISDSWVGPRHGSLFGRYSAWARDWRDEARGTDDEIRRKVEINKAIQMIYSSVPSGLWRPDWLVAIQAEARCRHWAKAFQASQDGMTIVGLTKEDEVAVLVGPDDDFPRTDADGRRWVGSYEVGTRYGCVSLKGIVKADEWIRGYERITR